MDLFQPKIRFMGLRGHANPWNACVRHTPNSSQHQNGGQNYVSENVLRHSSRKLRARSKALPKAAHAGGWASEALPFSSSHTLLHISTEFSTTLSRTAVPRMMRVSLLLCHASYKAQMSPTRDKLP